MVRIFKTIEEYQSHLAQPDTLELPDDSVELSSESIGAHESADDSPEAPKRKPISAALKACHYGDLEAVKQFVSDGGDVNAGNKRGNTLLMTAARKGYKDIVEYLIGQDAKLNRQDKGGNTCLNHSVLTNNYDIANILLQSGAKVDVQTHLEGVTGFLFAVHFGNVQMAELLLKHGANINHQTHEGATALIIASRKGNEEMVRFLLQNEADASIQMERGVSAYDIAIQKKFYTICSLLKGRKSPMPKRRMTLTDMFSEG